MPRRVEVDAVTRVDLVLVCTECPNIEYMVAGVDETPIAGGEAKCRRCLAEVVTLPAPHVERGEAVVAEPDPPDDHQRRVLEAAREGPPILN